MALALGMLVGLQREWADNDIAGIRSFPLITAFGAICGALAPQYGGWLVGVGLFSVVVTLAVADAGRVVRGRNIGGVTTEIAALVMYGVGALLAAGLTVPALVVSGATVVLLQWKRPLHALAARIEESELRGVTRLALVALVILPVLPDRTFGPYDVLNPRQVWTMVVLIVGISLGGYVAQRLLGQRAGTVVGGLLGGVVSSTATTVAEARRTREQADGAAISATVVILASSVVFARLLVEIAIAAPGQLGTFGPPIATVLGGMLVPCAVALVALRRAPTPRRPPDDPTDLIGAVVFGLLYAGVLLGSAAVEDRFGVGALYAVAAVSGLTDVDAITLSTAHLAADGRVPPETGWRIVLVAALSNLVFKGGAVMVLGSPGLRRRIAVLFGLALALGGAVLALWPG
jgi:uncharacterized membrane protein (DUF4010 family)